MTSKYLKYAAVGTACGIFLSGLETYMQQPRKKKPLFVTFATPYLDECTDLRKYLEMLGPCAKHDMEKWVMMVRLCEDLCQLWILAAQGRDDTQTMKMTLPLHAHKIHNSLRRLIIKFIQEVTPKIKNRFLITELPETQELFVECVGDYVYNIQMAVGDAMLY
tara:strand:+ start:6159 stop:6647 length:489 start_codon:yes stop_codon:yes gene_type:complete